jgi:hypothetical protein
VAERARLQIKGWNWVTIDALYGVPRPEKLARLLRLAARSHANLVRLQYDGLRYAVEASLRRGAGVIPWQLNESYPNAWCTCSVDWHHSSICRLPRCGSSNYVTDCC